MLLAGEAADVHVLGSAARNRAMHGDAVVVQLLPRSQWRRVEEGEDAASSGEHGADLDAEVDVDVDAGGEVGAEAEEGSGTVVIDEEDDAHLAARRGVRVCLGRLLCWYTVKPLESWLWMRWSVWPYSVFFSSHLLVVGCP